MKISKKKIFALSSIVLLLIIVAYTFLSPLNTTDMSIYNYTVKDSKGNDVSMEEYKGKVVLIVNTATECGFTPQYKDLQDLYLKYKDRGFEILDFPCNQFAGQAPGTDEELASFCEMKYNTTFKTFAKIDVNGDNADPLFKFLKENSKGFITEAIKWNFTKFLIDRNGKVVKRYAPTTNPSKIEGDIEKELQ